MSRGIANKATRTKKCSCDNPKWSVFEVRTTFDGIVVTTFMCNNCDALWDTKSRDARKYVDMSERVNILREQTFGEYYKAADEKRAEILTATIENRKGQIAELEKEINELEKEIKKLQKEKDMIQQDLDNNQ